MFGVLLALALVASDGSETGESAPESEEDCDALFYGLGRAQDLRRAFACYERDQNWTMLTICHLNGEGTARSVPRARAAFDRFQDAFNRQYEYTHLEQLLRERERNPKATKRIDFCTDVVGGAMNGTGCARILEARKRTEERRLVATVRKALPKAAGARLAAVDSAFQAFLDDERSRIYQLFIDGSLRGEAAEGQGDLVCENYQDELRTLERALPPSSFQLTIRSYQEADAELNQVYRKLLRSWVEDADRSARTADSEERRDWYRTYAADVRKTTRDAQRRWIRYRDAWADLIGQLAALGLVTAITPEQMKTLITEDRIRELKHRPLGGG